MQNRIQLANKLKKIKEDELRKLLCLTFTKAGLQNVEETHGTQEYGKDIVFTEIDRVGNEICYACVVKAGDINQSVLDEVKRQVREAFNVPYTTHKKKKVEINQVIVITNGRYKSNAKTVIAEEISEQKKYISYWDINDLIEYIIQHETYNYLKDDTDICHNKYNEYIRKILEIHKSLKFLESDFGVNIDALEELEVNIKARSKRLENEKKAYLDKPLVESYRRLTLDVEQILSSKKNIIIKGIATSGKTSSLKRMGKILINKSPDAIVFFFELHKIVCEDGFELIKNLENYYNNFSGKSLDIENLAERKVLILLDGLDELTNDKCRSLVMQECREVIQKLSNVQIAISSRESKFLIDNLLINTLFEIYTLLPLNVREMIQIGDKIIDKKNKAQDFIKLVKKSEIIKSFPKTPLTTILLAILFKEDKIDVKELPRNITELYSKFTDIFLDKWEKSKGVSEQYKFQQKQFILQNIAKYLHTNNKIYITHDELINFLSTLRQKHPIDDLKDPELFLASICSRSSILIRNNEVNSFRFFHLTIQEYLAASILDKEDENMLVQKFLDDWWLNASIFYTGFKPHKSDIITRIYNLEIVPVSLDDKSTFIIHASKVLQSAHLIDNLHRKKMLLSILHVFNETIKEVINELCDDLDTNIKRKTILDVIIWARSFFDEFLSSQQFLEALKQIWEENVKKNNMYIDITEYCISYSLAKSFQNPDFLLDFVLSKKNINVRWLRITEVDVYVNKLKLNQENKRITLRIRNKAKRSKEYINQQFTEKIKNHRKSITGL